MMKHKPLTIFEIANNTFDALVGKSKPTQPVYSVKAQLARSNHFEDIKQSEAILETMRLKEASARCAVIYQMRVLAHVANLAHLKHCDDESMMTFYAVLSKLQDADNACDDIRSDIALGELEIKEAKEAIDNPECWTDEALSYPKGNLPLTGGAA